MPPHLPHLSTAATEQLIFADPTYSLDDAIESSVAIKAEFGCRDVGPVDTLDPATLEAEYRLFYGSSPLSSLSPSPQLSRSASPTINPELCTSLPFDMPLLNMHIPPHLTQAISHPSPEVGSAADEQHEPHGNSRSRRNKKKSHANRRRKRQETRLQQDGNTICYGNSKKHIDKADIVSTTYDTNNIPSASSGFIALSDRGDSHPKIYELRELLEGEQIRLIKWNGLIERAIVDKDGRIIAVLVGRPANPDWPSVHRSADATLQAARKRCRFPKKSTQHRRGSFPALSAGISYGGGQKLPGNLHHSKTNARELSKLLKHKSFQQIASFGSKALLTWAPKLHAYYADTFNKLLKSNSNLQRNFNNSVFAAAAFNFGPRSCSQKHRDFANLPFGWCSITALGDFDPTRGGHLVLWDLNLAIEFPPGSTILIPSAAIAHSNTAIGRGETRRSFTQFTAGGLFCWVEHGAQPDADYFRGMSVDEKERVASENAACCKFGLSLFSTFEEIGEWQGEK